MPCCARWGKLRICESSARLQARLVSPASGAFHRNCRTGRCRFSNVTGLSLTGTCCPRIPSACFSLWRTGRLPSKRCIRLFSKLTIREASRTRADAGAVAQCRLGSPVTDADSLRSFRICETGLPGRRRFGPGRPRTCNQTVMSGGRLIGFVDFSAVLVESDRVCCVSVRSFLVRNWCGRA